MLAQVYQVAGRCTRSIVTAVLVAEVPVDKIPQDQIAFAEEHGGDFIEIISDHLLVA